MEPCCGNCRFWEMFDEDKGDGQCRRYPPKLPAYPEQELDGLHGGVFPDTTGGEWCGEYQPFKGHDGQRLPKPDNLPDQHAAGPRGVPHG